MPWWITDRILTKSETAPARYSILMNITKKGDVVIPKGVKEIGEYAFKGCTSLKHVMLPQSVMRIGMSAFYQCTNLTSITIPQGVREIGVWAFADCTSLTSIIIPESVKQVGEWAFKGCTSLTSITLPAGVSGIKGWMFYNCTSLMSIVYPISLNSVSAQNFSKDIILKMCVGFILNQDKYSEELSAEYIEYINENAADAINALIGDSELLYQMCHDKKIPTKNVLWLIEESTKRGNVEATAMLLEYRRTMSNGEGSAPMWDDLDNWDE